MRKTYLVPGILILAGLGMLTGMLTGDDIEALIAILAGSL